MTVFLPLSWRLENPAYSAKMWNAVSSELVFEDECRIVCKCPQDGLIVRKFVRDSFQEDVRHHSKDQGRKWTTWSNADLCQKA